MPQAGVIMPPARRSPSLTGRQGRARLAPAGESKEGDADCEGGALGRRFHWFHSLANGGVLTREEDPHAACSPARRSADVSASSRDIASGSAPASCVLPFVPRLQ